MATEYAHFLFAFLFLLLPSNTRPIEKSLLVPVLVSVKKGSHSLNPLFVLGSFNCQEEFRLEQRHNCTNNRKTKNSQTNNRNTTFNNINEQLSLFALSFSLSLYLSHSPPLQSFIHLDRFQSMMMMSTSVVCK
uniref:Putative secreted protein n=1 Tax=Anopheles triannulatus TaxID=58253 RepID=A0A2M4B189_9DIPT